VTNYAVQTNALCKAYGLRTPAVAVDGLSLNVPAGSIYGLLGRNSAGKTTTIRMLLGLARPTSGSIHVLNCNPAVDSERVRMLTQVGFVPEDKALLGYSARKHFEINRRFYPETWSDDLARKVCDRLELPLDTNFVKLSLGNKTKLALAVAIAQSSPLLILDEPTTGLDPVALDSLLRILVEDCTADGRTVLLSSHQLAEIEQIADHIGIMDRGKLLLEAPLDDIHAQFLRVTVAGTSLPTALGTALSTRTDRRGTQYVLRGNHEAFLRDLEAQGATVVDTAPLSLNEIFLELCRREESTDSLHGATA
jgi:ABC-2 type transport system ATP-binding protein